MIFLPDVTEAHVLLGHRTSQGQKGGAPWQVLEFGKNSDDPVQLWSATKIIPLVALAECLGKRGDGTPRHFSECFIQNKNEPESRVNLLDFLSEMIDYRNGDDTSNGNAAALKKLLGHDFLEKYVLPYCLPRCPFEFRGMYGDPAVFSNPEIGDYKSGKILLNCAENQGRKGQNLVPVRALSFLMRDIGLQHEVKQDSMSADVSDRFTLEVNELLRRDFGRKLFAGILLNASDSWSGLVDVQSKLGFGWSDQRERTEIVCTAFLQFQNRPNLFLTFAFRVATSLAGDGLPQFLEREERRVYAVAIEQVQLWLKGVQQTTLPSL